MKTNTHIGIRTTNQFKKRLKKVAELSKRRVSDYSLLKLEEAVISDEKKFGVK